MADYTQKELLGLVRTSSAAELQELANPLRKKAFSNKISLCSIVSAKSGPCDMDCAFCAQNALAEIAVDETELIGVEAIREGFRHAGAAGAGKLGLVTSGGALSFEGTAMLSFRIAEAIAQEGGVTPCCSFGNIGRPELQLLKEIGINRIHHNLETSKEYYPNICTTQSWEERYQAVVDAKEMGFSICCGGLFGLGESWEDRISLAYSIRELGADSVPLNFFNPRPGTALSHVEILSAEEALKIVSLFRLVLPEATIKVAGGRELIFGDRQSEIYASGANSIMTGNYLTTSGITPDHDRKMLTSLGLEVSG